ncbi:MAG: PucR family transcriptional regulator [Firmicutes bacterium]|nr:PucR family transcriptional regulator [Bacillota bacterium]
MKVTLKDCLELSAFSEARVLAGQSGLARDVRNVSVLEATSAEDVKLYKGEKNQLLMTGFFAVRDDVDAQCEIVRQAAADMHAALAVFHVGKVVKKIDERVISTADAEGLPLIEIPYNEDVSCAQAIAQTMAKILYSDNFSNRLISNTIFHLLNFEKYSDFQSAVRQAAISNDFQIVILSEDFNPILQVETRHRVPITDAINTGRERQAEKQSGDFYTLVDVDGVQTYWGPVNIDGEKHFMFIVDNEDSYSAADMTKLAEIIELAMGMWKYTPDRDVKADFIKALIRGNKSLAYSLKDEAGVGTDEIVSVFMGHNIDKGKALKIMDSFEKDEDLHIIRIQEEDETYGLILDEKIEEGEGDPEAKSKCAALFDRLKEEKGVKIFHVTDVDGIEGAGDACRLISESWAFVQNVFPYKKVFTKYEMALVSNCINIQLQGGHVKRNYMKLLDVFKTIGENKGRQLQETLETFVLDAGMNSGRTARIMNIHANTVQYRLKRINELLGVEVTGNRVIPGLTIALALKRLERVVS